MLSGLSAQRVEARAELTFVKALVRHRRSRPDRETASAFDKRVLGASPQVKLIALGSAMYRRHSRIDGA